MGRKREKLVILIIQRSLFLGTREGGNELKQPTESASKKELMRAGSSTAQIRHTLPAPRLGEKSKRAARTRTVGLLVGVWFAYTRTRNKLRGQFFAIPQWAIHAAADWHAREDSFGVSLDGREANATNSQASQTSRSTN